MRVFLDTNVFLRFFLAEEDKHQECVELLTRVEEGLLAPYTSNIVLGEIIYTLLKYYKQTKQQTIEKIDGILKIRNLTVIEKTDTGKSLEIFKKLNIKFGDCLIATQIPKNITLVSYDEDFKKIKNLLLATPDKLVNN